MATVKKPAQATKKDTKAVTKKAPAKTTTIVADKKAPAKVVAEKPKKEKPAIVLASAPQADTAKEVKARKAQQEEVKEEVKKETPKKPAPKPKKQADLSKMETAKAKPASDKSGKTAYHVSKRDNDGREWKVFIQGSDKVIKLFDTQKEALDYAKSLAKNKDDGSYVILHGLDGKIRKF